MLVSPCLPFPPLPPPLLHRAFPRRTRYYLFALAVLPKSPLHTANDNNKKAISSVSITSQKEQGEKTQLPRVSPLSTPNLRANPPPPATPTSQAPSSKHAPFVNVSSYTSPTKHPKTTHPPLDRVSPSPPRSTSFPLKCPPPPSLCPLSSLVALHGPRQPTQQQTHSHRLIPTPPHHTRCCWDTAG